MAMLLCSHQSRKIELSAAVRAETPAAPDARRRHSSERRRRTRLIPAAAATSTRYAAWNLNRMPKFVGEIPELGNNRGYLSRSAGNFISRGAVLGFWPKPFVERRNRIERKLQWSRHDAQSFEKFSSFPRSGGTQNRLLAMPLPMNITPR